MLKLTRTNAASKDFTYLVKFLDEDLALRDGNENLFYAQYNKIDNIRHAVVAYEGYLSVACGTI